MSVFHCHASHPLSRSSRSRPCASSVLTLSAKAAKVGTCPVAHASRHHLICATAPHMRRCTRHAPLHLTRATAPHMCHCTSHAPLHPTRATAPDTRHCRDFPRGRARPGDTDCQHGEGTRRQEAHHPQRLHARFMRSHCGLGRRCRHRGSRTFLS